MFNVVIRFGRGFSNVGLKTRPSESDGIEQFAQEIGTEQGEGVEEGLWIDNDGRGREKIGFSSSNSANGGMHVFSHEIFEEIAS